jgi:hypothetical protein
VQLDSDSVFESKCTKKLGKGKRTARESTVRVEYENGIIRVHARPTNRALATLGENPNTGGATQERQRA